MFLFLFPLYLLLLSLPSCAVWHSLHEPEHHLLFSWHRHQLLLSPFFLLPFLAAHTSLSLPPFSPSLRHFLFSGKKGGETASRVHVVNSRERKKRRFHSSSPLLPWVDASPSSSSLPFFQKPVIFVTICGIVGLVHMPQREICCNRLQ